MVAVYTIPSFCDYPQEIWDALWMGTSEIHENAQRNRVEFMADDCDYQKATEENQMMLWQGQRVHPAAYWILYEEEQSYNYRNKYNMNVDDHRHGNAVFGCAEKLSYVNMQQDRNCTIELFAF